MKTAEKTGCHGSFGCRAGSHKLNLILILENSLWLPLGQTVTRVIQCSKSGSLPSVIATRRRFSSSITGLWVFRGGLDLTNRSDLRRRSRQENFIGDEQLRLVNRPFNHPQSMLLPAQSRWRGVLKDVLVDTWGDQGTVPNQERFMPLASLILPRLFSSKASSKPLFTASVLARELVM